MQGMRISKGARKVARFRKASKQPARVASYASEKKQMPREPARIQARLRSQPKCCTRTAPALHQRYKDGRPALAPAERTAPARRG